MAKVKADLLELKNKFSLTKDDVWDCHGTLVMYHRACESVAQQAGIRFDEPKLLFAEGQSIAMLVTGHMGEESSWSIGEASPQNNKNAYPWAMAEKRAKDRVILKLARFSEVGVYSDAEADDFKKPVARAETSGDDGDSSDDLDVDAVIHLFESAKNLAELDARSWHAAKLNAEDKVKARDVYLLRKNELKGEGE